MYVKIAPDEYCVLLIIVQVYRVKSPPDCWYITIRNSCLIFQILRVRGYPFLCYSYSSMVLGSEVLPCQEAGIRETNERMKCTR